MQAPVSHFRYHGGAGNQSRHVPEHVRLQKYAYVSEAVPLCSHISVPSPYLRLDFRLTKVNIDLLIQGNRDCPPMSTKGRLHEFRLRAPFCAEQQTYCKVPLLATFENHCTQAAFKRLLTGQL